MKKITQFIIATIAVLLLTMSAVSASPITVGSVSVVETNDNYAVIVDYDNARPTSGNNLASVSIGLENGTMKKIDTVDLSGKETLVKSYKLTDVIDTSKLNFGENYVLVVSTSDERKVTKYPFLYGNLDNRYNNALGLSVERIEVDDIKVTELSNLQVINGDTVEIEMTFIALRDIDNARLEARLSGYEHATISDSTDIFSLKQGRTYTKRFEITIPNDIDSEEDYVLRIIGDSQLSGITYKEFDIYVDTQRHRLDIIDVIVSPNSAVEAGQAIIAQVRMKNRGQKSQDDVKVIVSIPELSIREADYVSDFSSEDTVTSDDILIYIPENAKAGTYTLVATAEFNNGYDKVSEEYPIRVLASDVKVEKNLFLTIPSNIKLREGVESTFEFTVGNPNEDAKPISINAKEVNWADVSISPNLAFVQGKDDRTFIVKVTPKLGVEEGEKTLEFIVKDGSKSVKELSVKSYVEKVPQEGTNILNVIVGVLLIVMVIVLVALIIAISRKNKPEKESSSDEVENDEEEYY